MSILLKHSIHVPPQRFLSLSHDPSFFPGAGKDAVCELRIFMTVVASQRPLDFVLTPLSTFIFLDLEKFYDEDKKEISSQVWRVLMKWSRWHPGSLWRILRLTKSYRLAVDEFIESASKDRVDNELLNVFEAYSRDEKKDGLYDERQWRDNLNSPGGKIFSNSPSSFLLATMRPYSRKFLAWYGDVICFPVDYRTERPSAFVLNKLWTFRPALVSGPLHMTEYRQATKYVGLKDNYWSRLIDPSILINANFSEATIFDFLKGYLNEHLHTLKKRTKKNVFKSPAPKWNHVEQAIRMFELIDEAKVSGRRIRSVEIFDEVYGASKLDNEGKNSRISQLKRTFPLKNVFERKPPTPGSWDDRTILTRGEEG